MVFKGEFGDRLQCDRRLRSSSCWRHRNAGFYAGFLQAINMVRMRNVEAKKFVELLPANPARLPEIDAPALPAAM
jgi:hypothetical protein